MRYGKGMVASSRVAMVHAMCMKKNGYLAWRFVVKIPHIASRCGVMK
jgi:hypothetical protein